MNTFDINEFFQRSTIPFSFDSRPLIAIDFDGVINPEAQLKWEEVFDDMTDGIFIDDDGFRRPMRYSPTVINFFRELSSRANIVWLSTWIHSTESFADSFNFPHSPWLGAINEFYNGWWKAEVIDFLSNKQRLLWIDDEISRIPEAIDLINASISIDAISPKTSVGLTPLHLERITEFVNNY